MLKLNNQKNLKQQKLHEAVLKHKVRNLRAKVQSLLPIHFCEKISKRNNRLKNQLMRKHQFQQLEKHHTRSLNSKSCCENKWKYTSGFNIKKMQPFQGQNLPQNNYFKSSKNSIYKTQCNCRNDDNLFIDNQCDDLDGQWSKKKENKSQQFYGKGYHFQKLTDEQIQQIEEDKLYYLGEQKHIKAYEQYTKQKYANKITIPISNDVYKSVSKSTIAIGTNKYIRSTHKQQTNTSLQSQNALKYPYGGYLLKDRWLYKSNMMQNKRQSKYQSQQQNSIIYSRGVLNNQFRVFRNTANDKLNSWNVTQNLARINEQQQVKRILLSMELKTKQQRVEQNFYKIRNNKIQIIQQQNHKQHIKILSAQQKKRKIYNEAGQIIQLTQKLRKKCIQRKTYKGKQNLKIQMQLLYPQN